MLACRDCNLSKLARVPNLVFLEKLSRRNDYLITSHHPLRATLMLQTGNTRPERRAFLQAAYNDAVALLIHKWQPEPQTSLTL